MWTGFTEESFKLLDSYKLNDDPKTMYDSAVFDRLIRSQFYEINNVIYPLLKKRLPEYKLTDKYSLSKHASLGNRLYHHFWAAIYRSSKKGKSKDIQFFWRIDPGRFTFGLYVGHQVDSKLINEIKLNIEKNQSTLLALDRSISVPRKLKYASDDVNGFLSKYLDAKTAFSSDTWSNNKTANIYFEYSRDEVIFKGTNLIDDMHLGFQMLIDFYRLIVPLDREDQINEDIYDESNDVESKLEEDEELEKNGNEDQITVEQREEALQIIKEVEFQNDDISEKDYIGGRKEFSIFLANKITGIFQSKDHKGTFTLHLEGKWGSGKSTFMNFLKKDLEVGQNWKVLEFNAWRYQHFIPTWWGFLENIKKSLIKKNKWNENAALFFRIHFFRFSKLLTSLSFIFGALFCLLTVLGIIYRNEITVSKDMRIVGTVITGLLGGSLILKPIKDFFSSSVFLSAKKINELLVSPALDPFEIAADYFKEITKSCDDSKYLAIFIDDLDRCKPEYAVKFLEGIQTLFKNNERKIFYLVSADKVWLKNCFENEYKNQKNLKEDESIGYYFLEKLFQMSTRLPNSNRQSDNGLINSLSGLKTRIQSTDTEKVDLEQKKSKLDESILMRDEVEVTITKKTEAITSSVSLEEVESEKTHLLTIYKQYLGTNPRTLKRILNSYEINRHLIALEVDRNYLSDDQLYSIMRCTILEQRWPDVMCAVENRLKILEVDDTINSDLKELKLNEGFIKELLDDINFMKLLNSITRGDVNLYLGLNK